MVDQRKQKAIIFIGIRRPTKESDKTLLAAKLCGIKVLLICNPNTLVDNAVVADIRPILQEPFAFIAETATKWLQEYEVLGIANWHDDTTNLRAFLCSELGLAGPSIVSAQRCTNKLLMKEALRNTRYVPKYLEVGLAEEDLLVGIETIGYPAILKPCNGTSSKGIFEILTAADAKDAAKNLVSYSKESEGIDLFGDDQKAIIEEKVIGDEVSVDGLIKDGVITFSGIVDFRSSEKYHLDYYKIFPSQLSEGKQAEVYQACESIIEILGLDNSAFHFEGCITELGFRFYEIAARPGAGCIATHLIPISTGINYLQQYLMLCCNQDLLFSSSNFASRAQIFSGIIYPLAKSEGTFKEVKGLLDLINAKGVEIIGFDNLPGSEVVLPPESYGAVKCVYAVVSSTSYDGVAQLIDNIECNVDIIID